MNETAPSPLDEVRRTTRFVAEQSSHVRIDLERLEQEVKTHFEHYTLDRLPPSWAQEYHYAEPHTHPDLTAQYVLVLDSLNFCFWPLPQYEYNHLARGLKRALERDPKAFDADRLARLSPQTLVGWLKSDEVVGSDVIPLIDERVRLLREVGCELKRSFGGLASNLIRKAAASATELVKLVTAHFPGFRDQAVYRGHQVRI